jgi:tetratricopeptide (TPR) repeat protein
MNGTNNARLTILVCALLIGSTLAVFWPVLSSEFVTYDDPPYVSENEHINSGLNRENLKWAFGNNGHGGNWHPLTSVSHMLDVQLFGLSPGRHHLVNLLFHAANSVLLFLLLKRMTDALWRSAFIAALFALHPLHVESVAWISERKDVLSGFFFVLSLLAYAKYAQGAKIQGAKQQFRPGKPEKKPEFQKPNSRATLPLRNRIWTGRYVLALICFALGLMSKPMLVTLPFVLLLLDFWPLQRLQLAASNLQPPTRATLLRLVLEKAPFFALSAASSVITFLVQKSSGAVGSLEGVPLGARIENGVTTYVAYLGQAFWPKRLAVFYPFPTSVPAGEIAVAVGIILLISAAAVVLARKHPYLPVGWFWYLGMLVPVIGLVQVGVQARADRYAYLPLIGVFIAVCWGVAALWQKFANPLSRKMIRAALASGAATVLVLLAVAAHKQALVWHDSRSLYQHAADVTEENYVAWGGLGIVDLRSGDPASAMTNLARAFEYARTRGAGESIKYYIGAALQMQGKGVEALPYLQDAVVANDIKPERNCRLGVALIEAGRLDEAETAIKQALEARPRNPEFQLAMAGLLHAKGQREEAEEIFLQVLAAHPDNASAHRLYADFLSAQGKVSEAEKHYAAAVEKSTRPDVKLRRSYAAALAHDGKLPEAVAQLKEAVKLESSHAQANFELAEVLSQIGQTREAVVHYEQAIKSEPKLVAALNNLAWILATDANEKIRNGSRAVELAERACQLTEWKEPFLMGTLAAGYAEAGHFTNAVAIAEKACAVARSNKLEDVARRNEELMQMYRAGKPYHEGK